MDRCFDCGHGGFVRVRRHFGRDQRRDYGDGGPGLRRPGQRRGWTLDGCAGRVRRSSQHGSGCGFRGDGGGEDCGFRFVRFDAGRRNGR